MAGRLTPVAVVVSILLMGCSTRPSGYSPEEWSRYRQASKDHAAVLEWVARDPDRTRAREALGKASPLNEATGDAGKVLRENDELEVVPMARSCMESGRDFKQMTIARLEERIGEGKAEVDRVSKAISEHEIEVNRIRGLFANDPRSRNDPRVREAVEANIRDKLDLTRECRKKASELVKRIDREAQAVATLR